MHRSIYIIIHIVQYRWYIMHMQRHSCIIHGSFMHHPYCCITCALTLTLPLTYHFIRCIALFPATFRFFVLTPWGVLLQKGSWTWAGPSWIPLAWQSTRTLESCTWPISRRRANSRAEVRIIRVASSEPTWMEVKLRRDGRWITRWFLCWVLMRSAKID